MTFIKIYFLKDLDNEGVLYRLEFFPEFNFILLKRCP